MYFIPLLLILEQMESENNIWSLFLVFSIKVTTCSRLQQCVTACFLHGITTRTLRLVRTVQSDESQWTAPPAGKDHKLTPDVLIMYWGD